MNSLRPFYANNQIDITLSQYGYIHNFFSADITVNNQNFSEGLLANYECSKSFLSKPWQGKRFASRFSR